MNRYGKRCVLYPRVSTEMQVDGYSLEGQKNMLTRFADREEMIVVDTYEDAGKSGKSIEGRPAFQKMLRDIEDGLDIDYILVYKLSRFGRNAADILNSLELVQSYGVNLICIEEGIDSSQTSGKLLISVLSAVAEIERENIIEQTMNGRREKARQGGWNGGFAPYGYTLEDNKLMIEETEAVAIRKIFELYTSSEIGLGGIANQLNLQGIRKIPRQNGTLEDWTGHFIKLILDNPVYCGKIAYGRRTKEKVKGTKNDYQMKRNDDYILTEGQHKGIVSEEVWEKAHAKRLRTGVKQPSKIGRDRVHLLSGLLKCPVCGSPMYTNKHAWTNKDGTYKEIYYYVCSRNRMVRGKHCEYKAMLKKTDIEPMVIEAIREIVRNEEYAQAIKKRIGVQIDTKAVDKELEGYQAKLKEVDLNKTRLEREIDSLPADAKYRERKLHDMTLRLDSLYDVIVELEEKIEDAKLRRDAIKQQAITLENIYKIMVNFDCVYNIINDEEKRNVVTALIKEIEIYRNDESEYPLKRIGLNFPVFKDGGEVTELLWDKGNTVDWVAQDMASYDWNDANANGYTGYELEAGDYVITARSNSHDVKLSETYTVAAGMNCTTDYITGNEIESLFVDDFTSVNDSLLSGMISRATGLTQPAPASKTDREISDDTLATLDGQYSYRSYMDQGYEEWFVNEDGIPSTWTQAATRTEGEKAPISIMDMAGIDFSLKIEDGEVVQGDDEGSQKWEAFMNQLTWEEMASLVNNGGGVKAIDAVDVVGAGVNETPLQLSGGTLWACPPILAATFNLDLAEEVGVMMGNEALFKGCSYWQGNAMNIHRSPLSGRNVEYYSQDGVHGGKFAAAVVAGVTSKGVTCHIKHMVLNDQESYRDLNGGVSTWATEQVIREIYAKPFEYALKVGRSTGVMSSFNRIGMVNSQLNLAMHKLVRNEWSNRAIFETDAWQGTYCPLDLMVRQGDNQVLGAGTTLPDIGLEIGAWDADGNCVRVSDGAEGTFLSQTHYAAVRRSAQEILWNYANSSAVHNGYIGFEPCVLEFDSYAAQSLPISFGDVDIATITLADGAQLPEGFTMSDAGVVTSDGSLAEGEWTVDIKLNGIDGYITLGAQAVIRVVDALHVSTTSLKVGEAANVTVDAPYYAYEGLVKVNPRFVSTVKHTDGTPVAQGEMEGFGGKTILPGTGDSVGGTLRIQNWYWKDASQVQGNNYDGLGALAFADIEATDARYLETADVEAGNYYQAYLYEFRVSDEDAAKLAEYGLTAEKVMAPVTAYQGITYDYNSALAITGTPTKAGEVEITVTLQIPLVRGFGSRFPNNVHVGSPTATEVTRTFTLTIGE